MKRGSSVMPDWACLPAPAGRQLRAAIFVPRVAFLFSVGQKG